MRKFIFYCSFIAIAALIIISCDDSSDINSPIEEAPLTEAFINSIDIDGNITQMAVNSSEVRKDRRIVATRSSGTTRASGHFEWNTNSPDFTWKQSFNARGDATSGRGQIEVKFNNTANETNRDHHGTILCVYADGGEAVVAYYIDRVKGEPAGAYQEGQVVWFRVIDNGEGNNDPDDIIYGLRYYWPNSISFEEAQDLVTIYSCQSLFEDYNWTVPNPIAEGNIQVQ